MLCVGYTDENRGATLFRHLEENRRYTIPILIRVTYHNFKGVASFFFICTFLSSINISSGARVSASENGGLRPIGSLAQLTNSSKILKPGPRPKPSARL